MDLTPALASMPMQVASLISATIAVSAFLDAVLPQPHEGSRWVPVRKLLHLVAQNYGNARNAVPAGSIPASVGAHVAQVRAAASNVEQATATLSEAAQGEAEALGGKP